MTLRRWSGLSLIVALWLGLALPALAQSGSVRVEDPDGLLGGDVARVTTAAQRLADAGAEVIVLAAGGSAGTDTASATQYLDRFLAENNIAPDMTRLQPNQIVIFVAQDAQRTELHFGQRWFEALRPVERTIQTEQMNPRFADGDLAGGLIAGIDAVGATINPPPSRWPYYLGGAAIVIALIAFAVPLVRRRQAASASLAGAREQEQQARRAAGVALADLGQLAQTAEDKAQYDQISYSGGDLERVQQLHAEGMRLFHAAQSAFDGAEEQLTGQGAPTSQAYAAVAARYGEAERLAQQASEQLRAAEQLRAELDRRGAPSTGSTTRLEP